MLGLFCGLVSSVHHWGREEGGMTHDSDHNKLCNNTWPEWSSQQQSPGSWTNQGRALGSRDPPPPIRVEQSARQSPWSGSIMSGQGGMPVASGGKAAEFLNTDIDTVIDYNIWRRHLVFPSHFNCWKSLLPTIAFTYKIKLRNNYKQFNV